MRRRQTTARRSGLVGRNESSKCWSEAKDDRQNILPKSGWKRPEPVRARRRFDGSKRFLIEGVVAGGFCECDAVGIDRAVSFDHETNVGDQGQTRLLRLKSIVDLARDVLQIAGIWKLDTGGVHVRDVGALPSRRAASGLWLWLLRLWRS